jgi:hypothetical protein
MQTKLTITLFGLFAEVERPERGRSKEGPASARAKARVHGHARKVQARWQTEAVRHMEIAFLRSPAPRGQPHGSSLLGGPS